MFCSYKDKVWQQSDMPIEYKLFLSSRSSVSKIQQKTIFGEAGHYLGKNGNVDDIQICENFQKYLEIHKTYLLRSQLGYNRSRFTGHMM